MPAKNSGSKDDLDPKVFDVSKPGKTPPPDSGKPVIVSHKPMVKDPMMSEKTETVNEMEPTEPKKDESVASRTGLTIKPLEGQEEAIAQEKKTISVSDKTPAAEPAAESTVSKKTEKSAQKAEASEAQSGTSTETDSAAEKPATTTTEGSGVVGAVAEKAKEKEEQKGGAAATDELQLSPEEIARRAEIQKLINERTYNVPIGEPHRSKNLRHFLIFFLVLILLTAVGFELAIDAGVIESDIPPVVDLIKN